jgi:cytochrome P450
MPGKVDLTDLDMWARAVPYGEFTRLRREAPVAWSPGEGPGFWSVARYSDIVAASRDVATFSSSRGVSFEDPTDEDMAARRTIIDTDPPEHTKLRKIVASTFSQRAVAVYEHFITGLTEQVLDRMPVSGEPFDFVDAVEAERAGLDAIMVSEHIVLGPSSNEAGLPANPRDYALPGNQDPATPWPSPIVLLSAIAAATTRIRLVASALISPLRHPLASAKDLATLDRLSGGRLVVQPTVSWHRDEYDALGVPFGRRGEILDERSRSGRKPGGARR